MSLNKDGTYIEHVTSNGRRTGWECYRRDPHRCHNPTD